MQLTDSTGQCPCSKQDFTETPVPCSPDHYPRVRKRGLSGTPLPSDSRVTIDCPWHRNESMTLLPPGQTEREREGQGSRQAAAPRGVTSATKRPKGNRGRDFPGSGGDSRVSFDGPGSVDGLGGCRLGVDVPDGGGFGEAAAVVSYENRDRRRSSGLPLNDLNEKQINHIISCYSFCISPFSPTLVLRISNKFHSFEGGE